MSGNYLPANPPAQWLGRTVLNLMGWRIEGELPKLDKFVVIGAHHTSNWDFVIFIALFAAGIDPRREAGSVSRTRYVKLAAEIKRILAYAIERGGTTLRDFVGGDGQPGYFQQELFVYGRGGEFCKTCGSTLREVKLGQRASVYCPRCQS